MAFIPKTSSSLKSAMDLTVEVANRTFTVRAGEFTWKGEEKALGEDETYTVEEDATSVTGYLVLDTQNDEIHILVDAMAPGDSAFIFEEQERYRLLSPLFWGDLLPPGSLEESDFYLMRVVQLEKE